MHIQKNDVKGIRKGVYRGVNLKINTINYNNETIYTHSFEEESMPAYQSQIAQAWVDDKMPELPFHMDCYDEYGLNDNELNNATDKEIKQIKDMAEKLDIFHFVGCYLKGNKGIPWLKCKKSHKERKHVWDIIKSGNYIIEHNVYGVITGVKEVNHRDLLGD